MARTFLATCWFHVLVLLPLHGHHHLLPLLLLLCLLEHFPVPFHCRMTRQSHPDHQACPIGQAYPIGQIYQMGTSWLQASVLFVESHSGVSILSRGIQWLRVEKS
uniref:Secreted protein n=1 Tax=Cacopsylla melanoneura TaxID=428564 RepID=A0A8D8YXS0_9HEMI